MKKMPDNPFLVDPSKPPGGSRRISGSEIFGVPPSTPTTTPAATSASPDAHLPAARVPPTRVSSEVKTNPFNPFGPRTSKATSTSHVSSFVSSGPPSPSLTTLAASAAKTSSTMSAFNDANNANNTNPFPEHEPDDQHPPAPLEPSESIEDFYPDKREKVVPIPPRTAKAVIYRPTIIPSSLPSSPSFSSSTPIVSPSSAPSPSFALSPSAPIVSPADLLAKQELEKELAESKRRIAEYERKEKMFLEQQEKLEKLEKLEKQEAEQLLKLQQQQLEREQLQQQEMLREQQEKERVLLQEREREEQLERQREEREMAQRSAPPPYNPYGDDDNEEKVTATSTNSAHSYNPYGDDDDDDEETSYQPPQTPLTPITSPASLPRSSVKSTNNINRNEGGQGHGHTDSLGQRSPVVRFAIDAPTEPVTDPFEGTPTSSTSPKGGDYRVDGSHMDHSFSFSQLPQSASPKKGDTASPNPNPSPKFNSSPKSPHYQENDVFSVDVGEYSDPFDAPQVPVLEEPMIRSADNEEDGEYVNVTISVLQQDQQQYQQQQYQQQFQQQYPQRNELLNQQQHQKQYQQQKWQQPQQAVPYDPFSAPIISSFPVPAPSNSSFSSSFDAFSFDSPVEQPAQPQWTQQPQKSPIKQQQQQEPWEQPQQQQSPQKQQVHGQPMQQQQIYPVSPSDPYAVYSISTDTVSTDNTDQREYVHVTMPSELTPLPVDVTENNVMNENQYLRESSDSYEKYNRESYSQHHANINYNNEDSNYTEQHEEGDQYQELQEESENAPEEQSYEQPVEEEDAFASFSSSGLGTNRTYGSGSVLTVGETPYQQQRQGQQWEQQAYGQQTAHGQQAQGHGQQQQPQLWEQQQQQQQQQQYSNTFPSNTADSFSSFSNTNKNNHPESSSFDAFAFDTPAVTPATHAYPAAAFPTVVKQSTAAQNSSFDAFSWAPAAAVQPAPRPASFAPTSQNTQPQTQTRSPPANVQTAAPYDPFAPAVGVPPQGQQAAHGQQVSQGSFLDPFAAPIPVPSPVSNGDVFSFPQQKQTQKNDNFGSKNDTFGASFGSFDAPQIQQQSPQKQPQQQQQQQPWEQQQLPQKQQLQQSPAKQQQQQLDPFAADPFASDPFSASFSAAIPPRQTSQVQQQQQQQKQVQQQQKQPWEQQGHGQQTTGPQTQGYGQTQGQQQMQEEYSMDIFGSFPAPTPQSGGQSGGKSWFQGSKSPAVVDPFAVPAGGYPLQPVGGRSSNINKNSNNNSDNQDVFGLELGSEDRDPFSANYNNNNNNNNSRSDTNNSNNTNNSGNSNGPFGYMNNNKTNSNSTSNNDPFNSGPFDPFPPNASNASKNDAQNDPFADPKRGRSESEAVMEKFRLMYDLPTDDTPEKEKDLMGGDSPYGSERGGRGVSGFVHSSSGGHHDSQDDSSSPTSGSSGPLEGFILARISTMALFTKEWQEMYYVFQDGQLLLFKNRADYQYNPRGSTAAKKKIPITHNLRMLKIKSKDYAKNQTLFNFMLEEVLDYGPANVAKFGGTNKAEVEAFFNTMKHQILSKRQQVGNRRPN